MTINSAKLSLDPDSREASQHPSDTSQSKLIKPLSPLSLSDFVAGISQLTVIGVMETTDIVEAIHRDIVLRPLGLLNHRYGKLWQHGISHRVYGAVKGITSLVGQSLTLGINQYSRLARRLPAQSLSPQLMSVVNVMNGVMGDHLVTHSNPLALPMTLYQQQLDPHDPLQNLQLMPLLSLSNEFTDSALADSRVTNKISGSVVIMLHGLCMGHLNWQPENQHSLGHRILQQMPDATLLYLNYNTGQRISTNGQQFAKWLHRLTNQNPDITRINLIGHSMGGLVSRSALYYGAQAHYEWVDKVNKLITLGTPHHGAVLERIGDFVQQSIAKLPFAGALAKLGDIRSVGIIDLRHGSVRDEDWQALQSRSVLPDEARHFTPLPEHISCYFLAGSLSEEGDESDMGHLLGDGLVNIPSALGEHTDEHTLDVPDAHKAVFYEVSHLALLTDERVLNQTLEWLQESQLG
ncbi:esterase/lipase family protein [Psychrobacter lutiphocae]|uniref:esterase/lipase family protein n=1 Tax=Psychrobacter lutiphocae TaxID=540500 RepID=UPI0003607861|nr:alpha/beta fold hydrolase [Psychrobacter lutiphocae]